MPGDNSNSDYAHLSQDVKGDWGRLSGRDKAAKLAEVYKSAPVSFTLIRDNGQRCCVFPCKSLGGCACAGCCQDGGHVVYGGTNENSTQDIAKVKNGFLENVDPSVYLGSIIQPCMGGLFTPTLEFRDNRDRASEMWGKIEGPCCFGGWSEMCCAFNFMVSKGKSAKKTGDLARIIKKAPASLAGAAIELFSESDVYSLEFKPDVDAAKKITVLSGLVLTDYMWFEGNTDKCRSDQDGTHCYCFYMYLCGFLYPCSFTIPNN